MAHLSFVRLSHGGGSLAPVSQNHAEQVVDSGLVSQLRSCRKRWIARNPALVLAAEHQQQSYAKDHTLPPQQQQTGIQTQSASPLNKPHTGSGQYQPTGNNQEPPTVDALGQYQPTGNDLTPFAGVDLSSTVIFNAQLTHLISRDDADVLMPDVPAVHDIATPRRMVGGRCCKWCISAQPASGKRKCAACCLSGTRFTHGEARLQQWCNRQTNHHYVHAHCVNGGLRHDHELHPKLADDQEAVDAVTRQRDTITRTAADTEVLLPFCSGSGSSLNRCAT